MTSVWPIATRAPYTIDTSARTRTTGVAHLAAPGNSGRQNRIMPNVPTLSSTPMSSTATAGGASSAASGSQELHRGVLPARAAERADEEVHRHEHGLEEDVEQKDVGGREDAHHHRL